MTRSAQRNLLLFAIPFLVTIAAYLRTVCPTVYTGDSGELAFAIATMGIAHPPGYPLLTLLGRFFMTLVPGNVGHVLNIFSALLASCAVGVGALVIRTILYPPERRKDNDAFVVSAAVAAMWGFGSALWATAVGLEVYSLGTLLMLLSLLMLLKYIESGRSSLLIASGYIAFLGLANHLTIIVMFAPILLALIWSRAPARVWFILLAFFAVAVSSYLYIPIRSSLNPVADWDHPASLGALINHITAQRYKSFISGIRFDNYFENMWRSVRILAAQFPLALGLFGIVGLFVRRQVPPNGKLILIAIFIVNFLTVAIYDIPDIEQYYLPSFFAAVIGLVMLMKSVLGRLLHARNKTVTPVILIVFAVLSLGFNYSRNDQSGNRLAYVYGMDILNSVPENSILISVADNSNSSLYYLHYVEGIRRDVEIYDAVKTFRMLPDRLHLTGADRNRTGQELCLQLMASNPQRSYLVKEHMLRKGTPFNYHDLILTPRGLVYKWGRWPLDISVWNNINVPALDSLFSEIDFKGVTMLANLYLCRGEDLEASGDTTAAMKDFRKAREVAELSPEASVHNSLGVFFRRQGWPYLAEQEYNTALDSEHLTGFERANIYVNIGNLKKDAGNFPEAADYYNRALKINENNTDARYNLALITAYSSLSRGNIRGAVDGFEQALSISHSDPRLFFNLGVLYDKNLNDTTKAVYNYQRFAELAPGLAESAAALKRIRELQP